jgi:hypothetical protein
MGLKQCCTVWYLLLQNDKVWNRYRLVWSGHMELSLNEYLMSMLPFTVSCLFSAYLLIMFHI